MEPYYLRHSTGYSMWTATDPFWSCYVIVDPRVAGFNSEDSVTDCAPLGGGNSVVESGVHYSRHFDSDASSPPPRVVEEDQTLAAAIQPPQPLPTNPWD